MIYHVWVGLPVLAVIFVLGCAVGIKEQAVKGLEAAHTVAISAQQGEISLYATGSVPGLTAAQHRAFHAALAKYFTAAAKLDTAMMAWKSGDPPPSDLPGALADVQEALKAVQPLAPSGLQDVVTAVQSAVTDLQAVVKLLQPK